MGIFTDIFIKILPSYLIIAIGYLAGRYLGIKRESIAPLLLYVIVPLVTFKGIFQTEINATSLSYPFFYLSISIIIALIFYQVGKLVFNKNKAQAALLSMACSLSNVGYFGLPLIIMFLGEKALGTIVLITLGFTLHENTLAYYLAAKGVEGPKTALLRTLKLPTVYASTFAVLANIYYNNFFINLEQTNTVTFINQLIDTALFIMDKCVGALTFLGMMMVGLALSQIKQYHLNKIFLGLSTFSQFIIQPAIAISFVLLNQNYLHYYSQEACQIIFLLSLVPIGANTITISTKLNLDTDTLSITVLASTLMALLTIPCYISFANILGVFTQ